MFIKNDKYTFARVSLVAVLITGLFSVRPAKAETIDFGGVKGGGSPNLDYGTAIAAAATPVKTSPFEQTHLLQYTTDGHVLGFASNRVFLAGRDHALTVEFKGGRNVTPVGIAASAEDGSRVPSLGRVTYPEVWNGVDVVYKSAKSSLVEATYLLQPGAEPADIRLSYNTPVELLENGTLRFAFETGYMTASAPIAFQRIEDQRYPVDVRFTLNEGLVGFALGKYNPNYPLTIDPLYTWHTFYGTTSGLQGGLDEGRAITTDTNGNIYVTGSSESTWNGPGSVAPLHGFSGNTDIVVIKLNSAGAYQWHTFYGAYAMDYAYAISNDGNGNIYVAGTSISEWIGPEFPVNPYSGADSEDIVVLKLNSAGAYQWHTFHGSSDTTRSFARDYGYAITSDASGVYVSGYSEAAWNGPGNKAPLNPYPGYTAIVVIKLFPAYGGYLWHTFYGSPSGTFGYAMTRDSNGNLYITGSSGDWNGPDNTPPLNAFSGTRPEIVVLKLNSAGAYQWHTFYGSSASYEMGYGITSDANGNVIVAGYSNGNWDGPNAIPPVNAYAGGSSDDIVVLKLNSAGAYQWHTFHGSTNPEIGYGVTTDPNGNVYVTGSSFSWNGPNDTAPLNASSGGYDIVLAKLNGAGVYQWHTYYGSFREDDGYALSRDGAGNMIVVGKSYASWNGPGAVAALNPHKHTSAANRPDIVVVKLDVTLPRVTVEQSASQPDPTNTSPILFDVVFSEPVISFDATDLDLSASSAPDTLSAVVTQVAPYNNTVYRVTISGMTGSGSVIISIPAGAAQDAAGNNSEASTSMDNLVTYTIPLSPTDTATATPTAIQTATDTPTVTQTPTFTATVTATFTATASQTSTPTVTATSTFTATVPSVLYVKWDANGADNGSSWTNAYKDLQSALAAASSGDEIWVAAGTYKPTNTTDRTISFDLKNGVAIYGGFAGIETSLAQRDVNTNVTALSGDIGVAGNNSDNSYHVTVGSNTDNSAVLDGFTITAGKTKDDFGVSAEYRGGGIYINGGSPVLSNLIFRENSARIGNGMYNGNSSPSLVNVNFIDNPWFAGSVAGAMVNEDDSSPTLTNVTFINNSGWQGGALFNVRRSNPTLVNVIFAGNSTSDRGGAIYNYSSNPILTNVTFRENSATQGGAIFNDSDSNPTLVNVTFAGNSASDRGGAIYNYYSNPTLNNVTFHENSAIQGGAIFNDYSWNSIILNSILYGDTGGEIYNYSTPAMVSYSIVQGGYPGTGNLDIDPLLDSLQDNGGFTQTMALLPNSPAINAGDDANCPATDQRGVTRPQGSHCDIGAYEYPNQAPTNISLSNRSVNENQTVGTTVGILSTSDPDMGDTFTYSFCGGMDDTSFSINGSTLKTAAIFDYETKSSYSVCIRSTDSGSLPTIKTIGISITNLVDTQTFEDVLDSYWAWNFVERLSNAGITGGCGNGNYCPESPVTRAQMAVFLERGIHGSSYNPPGVGGSTGFGDVPVDYWSGAWIKQLAAEGITGGCGSGNYCPGSPVTRAQMAIFLLRSKHGPSYSPPAVGGSTGFGDVHLDYWAGAWIKQLVAEGITAGCGTGNYCPEAPVTRAQMAVFLVRTFNLP